MATLLHRVVVQNQAVAADGIISFDIGINPLSVLLIALRPLNDTGTLANFNTSFGIASAINRLTIMHNGAAVVSMSGQDAYAMNYFRRGIVPPEANPDNVTNERRCVVLPVFLGKFAYDSRSCFPATRRGELTLELDLDIADTGYDGLRLSIEAVELMGASPVEFERTVTVSQTFAATGVNDVQIPLGNLLRGVLAFGTTGFGGAVPVPSWGRMSLIGDGMEVGYASTDFEVAQALSSLSGRMPDLTAHGHTVNAAGAGVEETTSVFDYGEDLSTRAFLDLDPTRDDEFSIDTMNFSSLALRGNAETADAVRIIGIERVKVG